MQIENDVRFFQKSEPLLYLLRPHAVHVIANIGIVHHLPCTAGNGCDEPQELHCLDGAVQFANITLNVGLQIAGVKQVAVGDASADDRRHGALEDSFKHLRRIRGIPAGDLSLKFVQIERKGLVFILPIYFALGHGGHVQDAGPSCQGFSRQLHELECL